MKIVKASDVRIGDTIFYTLPDSGPDSGLLLGVVVKSIDSKPRFRMYTFFGETNNAMLSCKETKQVAIERNE